MIFRERSYHKHTLNSLVTGLLRVVQTYNVLADIVNIQNTIYYQGSLLTEKTLYNVMKETDILFPFPRIETVLIDSIILSNHFIKLNLSSFKI